MVLYSNFEVIAILFGMLIFVMIGFCFFLISQLWRQKRFKQLLKVARQRLKRNLTMTEILALRLAYKRLDYDQVLDIITGVYNEGEDE